MRTAGLIYEGNSLEFFAVALLGDGIERAAASERSTDEADDEGDAEQDNHAPGSNRKALAVVAVDIGEDESPHGRQATYDEEHQALRTCTELGREELTAPQGVENLR